MPFLKEPVLHFFALGIAIFVWFSISDPAVEPVSGSEITIDDQDVDQVIAQFRATWNRPPALDELDELLNGLVREEVLVREARALGLDRGDSVVRNRLAQKMNFLTTALAQSAEPDDAVLQEHLTANRNAFLQPGQIAFRQISLGENPDPEQVRAALAALRAGADPGSFGSSSLLPPELPLSSPQKIESIFGRGLLDYLETAPDEQWAGPARSGYGLHLVLVVERKPPELPPFEMIRDAVLSDWRRNLSTTLLQAQIGELTKRYQVSQPTRAELAEKVRQ